MFPNQNSASLKAAFEKLGLKNVRTVISSGNVIFDSQSNDVPALESKIEAYWPKLGFNSTTIIRSIVDLQKLRAENPFGNTEDTPKSKLNVTFLKHPPTKKPPVGTSEYRFITAKDGTVGSVTDTTKSSSIDTMSALEKHYGKEITTRTWKTVDRILKASNH